MTKYFFYDDVSDFKSLLNNLEYLRINTLF